MGMNRPESAEGLEGGTGREDHTEVLSDKKEYENGGVLERVMGDNSKIGLGKMDLMGRNV
jgi:hypothetical protein